MTTQEHPLTDDERREYRQAIANLTRLIEWLEQHGIGAEVGIRSTVADHEHRLNALEARV